MTDAERYNRLKAEGRCTKCGRPATEGRSLCAKHLEIARHRSWLARVKSGRCGECGRIAVKGRTLCEQCLSANDDNQGERDGITEQGGPDTGDA